MNLRGQQGYAMAALLVALSIMAVLMTVAMPTWRQIAQREKEAELIFRGQQYARAIGLFQKKSGPGVLPPNIDVLVTGHFLRKQYKDPITGKDFDFLTATQAAASGSATPGSGTVVVPAGRGDAPTGSSGGVGAPGSVARGGIMGVASKSKDASIRIYNGRTHYNEWQFVYVAQTQAPGQGQGGAQPQRGGSGQRGSGAGGGVGGGPRQPPGGPGGAGGGARQPPGGSFGSGDGARPQNPPPFGGNPPGGFPRPNPPR